MKVDVAISFYKGRADWPLVARGLEQNLEHIARVIVVNDEPWEDDWRPELTDKPVECFDLPARDTCGISRCVNHGVFLASSEWVLHLDDDIFLPPGALATMIERIQTTSQVVSINLSYDEEIQEPGWEYFKPDPPIRAFDPSPWNLGAGACWLAYRKNFLTCPWNEELTTYGNQDFEWILRWSVLFVPYPWILCEDVIGLTIDAPVSADEQYRDPLPDEPIPKWLSAVNLLLAKYCQKYRVKPFKFSLTKPIRRQR